MANNKNEVKIPPVGRSNVVGAMQRFAPSQKPKNTKAVLMRIVKVYARSGKAILIALVLTIISTAISVSIPLFVGKAFNTFDVKTNTMQDNFMQFIFIIIVLYISNWIITTINGVIMLNVSQKLVYILRSEFFNKLQKLPLVFFDTRSHGDTMSRLTNDVDNISSTIAQTATQLVSSVLTVMGSFFVMISLNIPLTFIVLICIPLVFLLTKTITSKSRVYFLEQQKSLGKLNGIIEENIAGLKIVKAFGRKDEVIENFSQVNSTLYENSWRAQVWAGFMMPFMNVINNLTFTLVAIVGGILSVQYGLLVGTVVSFLSYAKQFGQPLNAIAGLFNTIQSALAGAERVFEIMDQQEEAPNSEDAVDIQNIEGNVTFKDVCFSYEEDKAILKNINFDAKAGEVIALVGETGAGKTTIVNLLTRFYDANSGSIMIDNIDIKNIKRNNLRKCFSVVLQDTCLFTGTIMDNIRYGRQDATDDQVVNAAKLAHANEFIEKLPKGYNTRVSGVSDNLSQGQKQLIAISRAILCDCPILLLDEATSSVDTKTEKDIQRALLKLMKNHTSFIIAHRLSTIRDADKIMVIGDGRILEVGDHKMLMNLKGKYYSMVVSQTS